MRRVLDGLIVCYVRVVVADVLQNGPLWPYVIYLVEVEVTHKIAPLDT